MMIVELKADNGDAEMVVVGRYYVDGGKLYYDVLDPDWNRGMWEIVNRQTITSKQGAVIDPKKDPEAWVRALPYNLYGSYLCAAFAKQQQADDSEIEKQRDGWVTIGGRPVFIGEEGASLRDAESDYAQASKALGDGLGLLITDKNAYAKLTQARDKAYARLQRVKMYADDAYFAKVRKEAIDAWTSSSTNADAVAFKHALKEEFGFADGVYDPRGHGYDQERISRYRPMVKRLYSETQKRLASEPIKLYRGMGDVPYALRSVAESWTSEIDTAQDFASDRQDRYGKGRGVVLTETVDYKRILVVLDQEAEHIVLSEAPKR